MAIAWQWAEAWNSFLVGTVEVSAPAPEAQQRFTYHNLIVCQLYCGLSILSNLFTLNLVWKQNGSTVSVPEQLYPVFTFEELKTVSSFENY